MLTFEKVFRFHPAAVFRFTGEDHAAFLQGQGTADLRGPVGMCRYCLWLDHRGLIHGDGFVLKTSEAAMLLVSYACPATDMRARFERHIIADDVEIEDLTEQFALISIHPAAAEELLGNLQSPVPGKDAFSRIESAYCYQGRRLGTGTVDILLPASMGNPFDTDSSMSPESAEASRVAAGIPLIPQDGPPGSLNPLELNILSALSFTKGCYLGQEVVSRVHRLQRNSKRLARFSGETGTPIALGDLQSGGQVVGAITSVVKNPDTVEGLGWLKTKIEDGAQDFDGLRLQVGSLPAS